MLANRPYTSIGSQPWHSGNHLARHELVLSEDSIYELQPGEAQPGDSSPRTRRSAARRTRTASVMWKTARSQNAVASRNQWAARLTRGKLRGLYQDLNSYSSTPSAAVSRHHHRPGEIADKADVHHAEDRRNLGAAKIRLRSLGAAVEERERNKQRGIAAVAPNDKTVRLTSRANSAGTGSEAPTPGRQMRSDTVMKANPKLETVKAASRRAATASAKRRNPRNNSATMSKYANRVPFGKDMKDYTIVAPQIPGSTSPWWNP